VSRKSPRAERLPPPPLPPPPPRLIGQQGALRWRTSCRVLGKEGALPSSKPTGPRALRRGRTRQRMGTAQVQNNQPVHFTRAIHRAHPCTPATEGEGMGRRAERRQQQQRQRRVGVSGPSGRREFSGDLPHLLLVRRLVRHVPARPRTQNWRPHNRYSQAAQRGRQTAEPGPELGRADGVEAQGGGAHLVGRAVGRVLLIRAVEQLLHGDQHLLDVGGGPPLLALVDDREADLPVRVDVRVPQRRVECALEPTPPGSAAVGRRKGRR